VPRTDLLSAALRHCRDAELLLKEGPDRSVEQALHLVGFGPECVRKACIDDNVADQALGHAFQDASDTVLEFLLALDPAAARYEIANHASQLAKIRSRWRVECRYLKTGTANPSEVDELVKEGRQYVDRWMAELWCDGVVADEVLR
jgi:hypothetical protein